MATALQKVPVFGEPFDVEVLTPTTPGTEQELFNFTVAAGIQRSLHRIRLECEAIATGVLYLNDNPIASLETGPGKYSDFQKWDAPKKLVATDNLKFLFKQLGPGPTVNVGAFLNASDKTV